MTIEQTKVVDFISIEPSTGNLILTISDHLEWDSTNEHFFLLQEKLNNYLAFIESGEILESFPNAQGRPVTIDLVCKYSPSRQDIEFLEVVKKFIQEAGFKFSYRVFQD